VSNWIHDTFITDSRTKETLQEEETIIIEIGSFNIKIGCAREPSPKTFPPLVAVLLERHPCNQVPGFSEEKITSGWDVLQNGAFVCRKPVYFIENGRISDPVHFKHVLKNSSSSFSNSAVIIMPPSTNNPSVIQDYVDYAISCSRGFNQGLHAPAIILADKAVMAMYASGREVGLAVVSGDNSTRIVPIYYGSPLHYASVTSTLAGSSVTDVFAGSKTQKSVAARFNDDKLKRQCCRVAPFSSIEQSKWNSEDINFHAAEVLFDPSKFGRSDQSISQLIVSVIDKCDPELRTKMFGNIVLCGGNTKLRGFSRGSKASCNGWSRTKQSKLFQTMMSTFLGSVQQSVPILVNNRTGSTQSLQRNIKAIRESTT
jgi:actin-related protein